MPAPWPRPAMELRLGVIRAAVEAGKTVQVFADETRPFLQGARLTAWELEKDGIPVTVITDSMAGHFMQKGKIDCVIVGADRIAANGDVANKIGTYRLAVLAKENGIPFYVAAPISTLDLSIPDGSHIPIEERDPDEVRKIKGIAITPPNMQVANPAFDVTPNRYVSAIITERGIARRSINESLKNSQRSKTVGSSCQVSRIGSGIRIRNQDSRSDRRWIAMHPIPMPILQDWESKMLVLGIESSCDETAAALVEDGHIVLSNVVASQVKTHRSFGGVVPELASREHLRNIGYVVRQAFQDAGKTHG